MLRPLLLASVLASVLAACKGHHPEGKASPAKPPADPGLAECAKAKQEGQLAWIADDYPAALACARARKVPLVVDLWAPWCHTCLSMQTTVFLDASFLSYKTKLVYAKLDTDRESNAAPLARLSLSAWPTFYVINSADEKVLARFIGGGSVAQIQEFLDAGVRAAAIGGVAVGDAHLLSAERALAVKDFTTAEEELTTALKVGPVAWMRRPEVLESLMLTKYTRGDFAGCLDLAERYLDETGNAANASDFLAGAMGCAEQREQAEAVRVKALRERAVARWKMLLADPTSPMSVDDRADAMTNLRETLDKLGKADDAKAIAETERALLDLAAEKSASPIAAMTFNWPRAEVYVYLHRPLDLVPALEKSAADLPKEYDPRARLGWIYLKAGKLDDATKWTDQALAMVYGPRKARVLAQRAEIAAAAGDKAAERSYREQVVTLWESLPAGQQSPENLAKAKQALAALDTGSAH